MTENYVYKINYVLLSASNSSSKIVNPKHKPTLTNSYIECFFSQKDKLEEIGKEVNHIVLS